jgi:hypothetical protein
MDAPDTVTEATQLLAAEGYTASVRLVDGKLDFGGESHGSCAVADAVVEHMFRFEGESDPGDEMVVFALRDPSGQFRGTLVSGYGPSAEPDVFEHVSYLASRVSDV